MIDGGVAHVGDLVEMPQFPMTISPIVREATSRSPSTRSAVPDALDRRFDLVAADRPLLERLHDAGAQLVLVERLARLVVLDDLRHDEFRGLECRESLAAGLAFAPAPDLVTLAGEARVRHFRVVVIAEWAVHCRPPAFQP